MLWQPWCMKPTTHRGGHPQAGAKPAPLTRQERLEGLLADTKRRVVPIRTTFVQQGRGADTKPGPLHKFLTAHDERGLDAYLVAHAMASASSPWNCRMLSDAWIGALGLDENASEASAKTALSKIMRRLEKRQLITRERSQRLSDVVLLKEDGSGEPYVRDLTENWLQFPHSYWLEGHYKTLSLPAKVMLIIALSLQDGFWLPYDYARAWYGVSSDSAEEGLRELRDVGLLDVERTWVKAPRSATGWTERLLYTLQRSFATADRRKAASLIRKRAAGEDEVDSEVQVVSGLLAPVMPLPQPTLADFFAQPSDEKELTSQAAPA